MFSGEKADSQREYLECKPMTVALRGPSPLIVFLSKKSLGNYSIMIIIKGLNVLL